MKKYLLCTMLFICQLDLAQSIIIDPSTPFAACTGDDVTVNFTPNGIVGPYTIKLRQGRTDYLAGYGGGTSYETISTEVTSSNSASFTIPAGYYDRIVPGPYGGGTSTFFYFFEIGTGEITNRKYDITLLNTCNSIRGIRVPSQTICSPSNFSIDFVAKNIDPSNIYTVELFNNSADTPLAPIEIGTASGNTVTSIPVSIPSGIANGYSYFIRLKSSNPVAEIISLALTMGGLSSLQAPFISENRCEGSPISFSYQYSTSNYPSNSTFELLKDGVAITEPMQPSSFSYGISNATTANSGNYSIKLTTPTGCIVTSPAVLVNVLPVNTTIPILATTTYNATSGTNLTINADCSGDNLLWFDSYSQINAAGGASATSLTVLVRQNSTVYASCAKTGFCNSAKVPITINAICPDPMPTFDNFTNESWINSYTWLCNKVPTAADNVLINQNITRWVGSNAFANNVTNNGTLALSAMLTASGNIINNGIFNGSNSSLSCINFANNGNLFSSLFSYDYAAFNITGALDALATSVINLKLGGTTTYDQLNITGNVGFGGTLKVTLQNSFVPVLGNVFTLMTFGSHTGTFNTLDLPTLPSGLFWNLIYTPASTNTRLAAAGQVTLTVANSPLPIRLVTFDAQNADHSVILTWQTAEATNASHFEIERSSNSKLFTKIGEKKTENGKEILNYSFIDSAPENNINYYRLKSVDIDGKYEYSKIISVKNVSKKEFSVYPNPAQDYLIVKNESANSLNMSLLNLSGQSLIHLKNINKSETKLDLSQVPKGLYFLQIADQNVVKYEKIIKE